MIIKLFLVCVSLKAKPIKILMKICRTIIIKPSRFPIDWTYKCCRFTPWGCRLDMKNTWEMRDSMRGTLFVSLTCYSMNAEATTSFRLHVTIHFSFTIDF